MWVVYDEYTGEAREEWRFAGIEEAAEFIENSDYPLTYRIRYED